MGVQGLLPLLKSVVTPLSLATYEGQKVGVDAYAWMHRAAYTCSSELCLGQPTDKWLTWFISRVKLLLHYKIAPVIVFDGAKLPMKKHTEESRRTSRDQNHANGLIFLKDGNAAAAHKCFQKAVNITPEMAHQLIVRLGAMDVEVIVAPYEADAQLAYLSHIDYVHAVISEDSDLLVFGCKRILFKMDAQGNGQELRIRDLGRATELNMASWSVQELQQMCVLAGCDYLESLPGMGIKRAHAMMRAHKTADKVVKRLRVDGKQIPAGYERELQMALLTFRHQRVFCPLAKRLVHLSPLPPSGELKQLFPDGIDFLGKDLSVEIAQGIASGRLHPDTHQPFPLELTRAASSGGLNNSSSSSSSSSASRSQSQAHSQHSDDGKSSQLLSQASTGSAGNGVEDVKLSPPLASQASVAPQLTRSNSSSLSAFTSQRTASLSRSGSSGDAISSGGSNSALAFASSQRSVTQFMHISGDDMDAQLEDELVQDEAFLPNSSAYGALSADYGKPASLTDQLSAFHSTVSSYFTKTSTAASRSFVPPRRKSSGSDSLSQSPSDSKSQSSSSSSSASSVAPFSAKQPSGKPVAQSQSQSQSQSESIAAILERRNPAVNRMFQQAKRARLDEIRSDRVVPPVSLAAAKQQQRAGEHKQTSSDMDIDLASSSSAASSSSSSSASLRPASPFTLSVKGFCEFPAAEAAASRVVLRHNGKENGAGELELEPQDPVRRSDDQAATRRVKSLKRNRRSSSTKSSQSARSASNASARSVSNASDSKAAAIAAAIKSEQQSESQTGGEAGEHTAEESGRGRGRKRAKHTSASSAPRFVSPLVSSSIKLARRPTIVTAAATAAGAATASSSYSSSSAFAAPSKPAAAASSSSLSSPQHGASSLERFAERHQLQLANSPANVASAFLAVASGQSPQRSRSSPPNHREVKSSPSRSPAIVASSSSSSAAAAAASFSPRRPMAPIASAQAAIARSPRTAGSLQIPRSPKQYGEPLFGLKPEPQHSPASASSAFRAVSEQPRVDRAGSSVDMDVDSNDQPHVGSRPPRVSAHSAPFDPFAQESPPPLQPLPLSSPPVSEEDDVAMEPSPRARAMDFEPTGSSDGLPHAIDEGADDEELFGDDEAEADLPLFGSQDFLSAAPSLPASSASSSLFSSLSFARQVTSPFLLRAMSPMSQQASPSQSPPPPPPPQPALSSAPASASASRSPAPSSAVPSSDSGPRTSSRGQADDARSVGSDDKFELPVRKPSASRFLLDDRASPLSAAMAQPQPQIAVPAPLPLPPPPPPPAPEPLPSNFSEDGGVDAAPDDSLPDADFCDPSFVPDAAL